MSVHHLVFDSRNVPHDVLSAFRPSTGQTGPSVPGRQPGQSRANNAGGPVSVPPPLSQQDAAQALLHGGERPRSLDQSPLRLEKLPEAKSVFLCAADVSEFTTVQSQRVP